jgi:hypothetical protein
MILLFVLLAGIGLSHIIVDGSIFAYPRGWVVTHGPEWLKKLISCYQCTGFWTGLLVGVASGIFINEFNTSLIGRLFVMPILYGFAVSYLSMTGAALLNYLDRPWGNEGK